MKKFLPFLVLPLAVLNAQQPSPSPTASPQPSAMPLTLRESINSLNGDEARKAVDAIRTTFFDTTATSDEALHKAELEGLIRRLSPGASIVTETAKPKAAQELPFLAEILDSQIGYLRLGSISQASLEQMDASLADFNKKKVSSVILDLRSIPYSPDFPMAADFAGRFCPKGKVLFSIRKPSDKQERLFTSTPDPVFSGLLVVLTDSATAGAAEVLAATLRNNAKAMIVGAGTSGEAVEFTSIPLSGGRFLRIAVAQAILPESTPIYPGGVKPDIAVSMPKEVEMEIFKESKDKGVSQFVFETERHHLNEAALVANTNPEIGDSDAEPGGRRTQLRDTVLQRGVDLVTAVTFYHARNQAP